MKIFEKKQELKEWILSMKNDKKTVGFVPTMGALHDGHLSLVTRAKAENDIAIVSIFVNPTQFNDKNDLKNYPRTLSADVKKLENADCDAVFAPTVEDMYDENELEKTFSFDFGGLDLVMEGLRRPGHFNGVVQVVGKLFDAVRPDKAYFGEKDFQQLAIIRRLNLLKNFRIQIVGCPIIREKSGLAQSSRNALLSQEEREIAANIFKILSQSKMLKNSKTPKEIQNFVEQEIAKIKEFKLEYFQIIDGETLQEIDHWQANAVGCIALYCGKIRLIDNIFYQN